MLLFVINGATGIPIRDIVREGVLYFVALMVSLILLIAFPELVLWLPRLFGYQG
jgi:TRAP-type C4-dicarboxylate transport system permease large subunit